MAMSATPADDSIVPVVAEVVLAPDRWTRITDPALLLDELLRECVRLDASDLHLAPGLPPYYRTHGVLEPPVGIEPFSSQCLDQLVQVLARQFDKAPLEATGSLDGAITSKDNTRYRFNIFRRGGQLSIALRRLEDRFRSLADLGLPDALYSLCDLPDGLVIVAGPTGAGKSTTLATLIDRVNRTRRAHIVTIEDPIEYVHRPLHSLVNQRQIGLDTPTFNDALVASLRQDPDVILVGEIRDLATIRTAITAAETGHLVFTTVHAGDCVGTVERLVSVFPADEQHGIRRQLSLVMRAIVAQHLLIADGAQGVETAPDGQTRRRGRVVASEVLFINGAVGNLIATGKSAQIYSAMESGAAAGMQTQEECLARLWSTGRISEATAIMAARNPEIMRDRHARMSSRFNSGTRNGGGK